MKDTYFSVTATFVQLEGQDNWSMTLHDHGDFAHFNDSRWLGTGNVDRFTLHDILKVLDTRVESAMIKACGLQTVLDF